VPKRIGKEWNEKFQDIQNKDAWEDGYTRYSEEDEQHIPTMEPINPQSPTVEY
jgi:hypothetical protein